MLYYLSTFSDYFLIFNLFRYITFRTGAALLTSFLLVFFLAPFMIEYLRSRQGNGQPIREDGPTSHFKKAGTPTMGGIIILLGVFGSTFLWSDLSSLLVLCVIFVGVLFGLIGFYDDYCKVSRSTHRGISARVRLSLEFMIAVFVVYLIIEYSGFTDISTTLTFPFFKTFILPLGWLFFVFAAFVIVSAGNAVNLTDGLDGLAIVPVIVAALSFGLISYLSGNVFFADYLQIHYVIGTGELAVICGAIIGSGLGFLWYNAHPASIFMGDTGSLSLGGMLGTIAVATKHELVLAMVGGLFVLEALSVILQVGSYKMTGRRIFKMAPLHHHFEHQGWSESQVVIRFWILSILFALIGLSTLKLR